MASVLFVVGNVTLSAGDQIIEDLLDGTDAASSRSDTVEVRGQSDPPANFDAYDLIVVSETVSSGTFWTSYSDLDTEAKPVICLENGNWDEFRMASSTTDLGNDSFHLAEDGDTHHLGAGFVDDTTTVGANPQGTSTTAETANTGAGADLIWASNNNETHWKVFGYDTSATMTSGTAPARRVAFGLKDPSVANITADGKTILIAAFEWALGEDGAAGISGSAAITEPVDVVAASGAVAIAGSAAITEPVDTVAGAGAVLVAGSAAIAEPVDVVAASGSVASVGSAAITEPVDVAAASGVVEVSGTAAITEPVDVAAGSGAVAVSGSAAITEPVDVVAGSGTVAGGVTGTATITEPIDIAAASGAVLVAGTGAIVEPVDTVSATGSTAINGSAAITEPVDVAAASGAVAVSGTAAILELVDLIAGSGGVTITGTAGITEPVDQVAATDSVAFVVGFWHEGLLVVGANEGGLSLAGVNEGGLKVGSQE